LEAAFNPQELFMLWMMEVQHFDSGLGYEKWVAQDRRRRPWRTLCDHYRRWIAARVNVGLGVTKKQALETCRELTFRFHLLWLVNELAGRQTRLAAAYTRLWPAAGTNFESVTADAIKAELANYVEPLGDFYVWLSLWISMALRERAPKDSPENPTMRDAATIDEQLLALDTAVRGLARDGAIKLGEVVHLEPPPHGPLRALAAPSLVECLWVDSYTVELAEVAALLEARASGSDASFETVTGGDGVNSQFADDISRIRAEAKSRFARFRGGTRKIRGRTYLDFQDYLRWPERKAQAKMSWGIQARSWDDLVAAHAGEGRAELAGVKIYKAMRVRGAAQSEAASPFFGSLCVEGNGA
jgi:hypothetical protein